jgi:hypothetical protein
MADDLLQIRAIFSVGVDPEELAKLISNLPTATQDNLGREVMATQLKDQDLNIFAISRSIRLLVEMINGYTAEMRNQRYKIERGSFWVDGGSRTSWDLGSPSASPYSLCAQIVHVNTALGRMLAELRQGFSPIQLSYLAGINPPAYALLMGTSTAIPTTAQADLF